jgi:hypothetical protein
MVFVWIDPLLSPQYVDGVRRKGGRCLPGEKFDEPQANRGNAQTQGQEAETGDRAGRAAKVNYGGHG